MEVACCSFVLDKYLVAKKHLLIFGKKNEGKKLSCEIEIFYIRIFSQKLFLRVSHVFYGACSFKRGVPNLTFFCTQRLYHMVLCMTVKKSVASF